MTVVTVESLIGINKHKRLEYTILTDEEDYLAGGQFYEWGKDKVTDGFRVGLGGCDDFYIEDSIGRFIPFSLDSIDSLIDTLLNFRQDNDKDIKIANLEAHIRELENDGD